MPNEFFRWRDDCVAAGHRAALPVVRRSAWWRAAVMRFALGVACALATVAVRAAPPASVSVLPAPAEVHDHPGTVAVDTYTPIVASPGDAGSLQAARTLAELLRRTRGLDLKVTATAAPPAGAIVLALDPQAPVLRTEGYALDIGTGAIRVRARDGAGLFYGAMTLWQLLTADGGKGRAVLGGMAIRDWPRFAWRGLMLDVARHYQTPETIKNLLDAMAEHKLNVFHWHLTDDQGWRLEIRRYPELTRIGAWRTPPGAGTQGVPVRYGGFYTQAQVRDIVAYAAARHITVVPELDMPGHAQAAVASYPALIGVTGQRPAVSVDWGVNPYLYNVDDRSFAFIEHVLDEVMALFPSRYIHLGGDEAIKDQWRASPAVQARMKSLSVKDENALQSWFTDRLGDYLERHGRHLIGWDEILDGGLPRTASVMSWRGTQGAVDAAKAGHDVVLAAAGWLYFDNLQSGHGDEPSGRLSVLPLPRVYGFEPVDNSLSADQARHVMGVEGTLWTEYIPSAWHVQHAVFPRIDALAEIAWSPREARDWNGFLARLPAQLRRYRSLGIEASDTAFAAAIHVDGSAAEALARGTARVALDSQLAAGTVRYTTDGSEPTAASKAYAGPFSVKLPVVVRAAVYAGDGTPLAAPRRRLLDRAALLTRRNGEFQACAGGSLGLRVPLLPDLDDAEAPVYDVDLFHACWIYPQAPLDTVVGIRAEVARLARNYGLAHDASKVEAYPARTAQGELEVREDRCDGPLLASLPLLHGDALGQRLRLDGALPARSGVHDLCLRITAPIQGPLYGLGAVRLLEAGASGSAAAAP